MKAKRVRGPGRLLNARRVGAVRPRLVIALGVVVVAGVLVAVGMTRGGLDSAGDEGKVFRVKRMSFPVVTTASGELEAKNETKLRCEVEGRTTITEIVEEGTFVRKGDVLVRLASDEIEQKLDSELLALESAKSDLIAAENAVKIQESDNASALNKAKLTLRLAQLELKKWLEGDVVAKREELQTRVESTKRNRDRLEEKFERSKRLYERDFISQDEYERDRIEKLEAESAYEIAKINLNVFEEYEYEKKHSELTSAVEEAKAELERVKTKNDSEMANRKADLNNKRQSLKIREEAVAELQEQLDNTVIKAPTDGMVVYATSVESGWRWDDSGPLKVGREVRHNEELIILPETETMVASVKIHESLVGKVRPGQRANVKIDAAGGKVFEGVVDDIGIMAESGGWRDPNLREYEVKIVLDVNAQEYDLKPSMRAEAEIILAQVEDSLAVPTHAVFSDGPVHFVYQPEGGRYERTPVAVGRRSDNYIEILGGLEETEPVLVVEPQPGQVVREPFDEKVVAELAALEQKSRASQRRPGDMAAMMGRIDVENLDASSIKAVFEDAGFDDAGMSEGDEGESEIAGMSVEELEAHAQKKLEEMKKRMEERKSKRASGEPRPAEKAEKPGKDEGKDEGAGEAPKKDVAAKKEPSAQ